MQEAPQGIPSLSNTAYILRTSCPLMPAKILGNPQDSINMIILILVSTWSRGRDDVRCGVFTAVTMKNGISWDVTPCGSCKNRRFGGT
jgi:hypothetical protein